MTERAATPATQITVTLDDEAVLRRLAGPGDENLRVLREELGVKVGARGTLVHVTGDPEAAGLAARTLQQLAQVARRMERLGTTDVHHALAALRESVDTDLGDLFLDVVVEARGGKRITPRGLGQKRYVEAVRGADVTLAIGPAGTGKTYLAVAMAAHALKAEKVARIILTRPAVEAGEKLGFLPGDLEAKINPFLRPLHDALHDLLGPNEARDLIERQVIEIAPLAFMRGRTLNESFVILDEAQNATREQMKMFLTRLGFGSKMVVCGDLTQTDLGRGQTSGLHEASDVLEGTRGVAVCRLTEADVVRHDLVQRIVRAYDEKSGGTRRGGQRGGGSRKKGGTRSKTRRSSS